jgi:Zn ribbon nucleic-acid-binding protein
MVSYSCQLRKGGPLTSNQNDELPMRECVKCEHLMKKNTIDQTTVKG